jgi:oligopeptide/dipeptide ABC transporter ATP-binding protein
MSYVPQNAMNSLDPVYKIGRQLVQAVRRHTDLSKKEARERAADCLESVGLDSARMNDYPHELSGGQQQRVVIALALLLNPSLIVADEITTGLDVVVQDEILELISDIQKTSGNSMIFISHDISAVAEVADRVAVMYGGRIVELGTTREVFKESSHPYTIGLRNSFPSLKMLSEGTELVSIPGAPPNLVDPPEGCRFAERCPFATEECKHEPALESVSNGHLSKCHYRDQALEFRERGTRAETWGSQT